MSHNALLDIFFVKISPISSGYTLFILIIIYHLSTYCVPLTTPSYVHAFFFNLLLPTILQGRYYSAHIRDARLKLDEVKYLIKVIRHTSGLESIFGRFQSDLFCFLFVCFFSVAHTAPGPLIALYQTLY